MPSRNAGSLGLPSTRKCSRADHRCPESGAITSSAPDPDAVIAALFRTHSRSLLVLARLFVDHRDAAEDIVQEAFIRFARSLDRLENADKAAPYLRSIVLNLARDHNRRGLPSLRHPSPANDLDCGGLDEQIATRDEQSPHDEPAREFFGRRPHRRRYQFEPSTDLFRRVTAGIVTDRKRRQRQQRVMRFGAAVALVTLATLAFLYTQGDPHMSWWIFEVIAFMIMVVLAMTLGPFIKRFGRSYAADVFRSNPSTGKSFIVLTDFAYYLIFGAYILFTTQVDRPNDWPTKVGVEQVQYGVARLGGILLIIGLLHGVNLLVLPVIGRLLTLNRRLDQQMREIAAQDLGSRDLLQGETGHA